MPIDFTQIVTVDIAPFVHGSEDTALRDAGRLCPFVYGNLRPRGHWDGACPVPFAHEVYRRPMALALGHVEERQCRRFGSAQPAADEHGQDRPIPQPFERGHVGRCVGITVKVDHGVGVGYVRTTSGSQIFTPCAAIPKSPSAIMVPSGASTRQWCTPWPMNGPTVHP